MIYNWLKNLVGVPLQMESPHNSYCDGTLESVTPHLAVVVSDNDVTIFRLSEISLIVIENEHYKLQNKFTKTKDPLCEWLNCKSEISVCFKKKTYKGEVVRIDGGFFAIKTKYKVYIIPINGVVSINIPKDVFEKSEVTIEELL